jgi:hypothetical protein
VGSRSSSSRRRGRLGGRLGRAGALLLGLLALGSEGCARLRPTLVQPHQRAYLSDRIMRPGSDRLGQASDEHVRNTREGAIGGAGTVGGGCGCN